MDDVLAAVANYLRDNGYPDTKVIFDRVISIFVPQTGRVFLHLDGDLLVIETPMEMGRQGRRPSEDFKLWVTLSDEHSLPTLIDYLSKIKSWAD